MRFRSLDVSSAADTEDSKYWDETQHARAALYFSRFSLDLSLLLTFTQGASRTSQAPM